MALTALTGQRIQLRTACVLARSRVLGYSRDRGGGLILLRSEIWSLGSRRFMTRVIRRGNRRPGFESRSGTTCRK